MSIPNETQKHKSCPVKLSPIDTSKLLWYNNDLNKDDKIGKSKKGKMVRLHMFQEDRLQKIWDQTSSTRIIAVKITLLLWCCAYLTWFQKSIWLCWSQIHWRNTNCLWLWSRLQIFKTLYRNITARILIKGFASESIKIERGVKQGNALSYIIFIICIDPLLRNLNNNRRVKKL